MVGLTGMSASAAESVVVATAPDGSVLAQVQSLDRFQAEQERLQKMLADKPKAYEDKVMDPSTLPARSQADESPDGDGMGVRSYVSETRLGHVQSSSGSLQRNGTELGQRLEFRQETLNYGDFSVQVDGRHNNEPQASGFGRYGSTADASSGRITLRNLGFPVTPHLFADTTAGDFSSEITNALARAYRVSLGTSTVRGLGARLFDETSDARFGFGDRGTLTGGPFPGFERSQGTLGWAGYSRRFADAGYAGFQLSQATDVPVYLPANSGFRLNVSSVAASVGYGGDLYQEGSRKARLMMVQSQSSIDLPGLPARALGVFLETGIRAGAYRHEIGFFSAQPNLRFGDYLMPSDNRGAYWRMDTSGLRLSWGLGLDIEEQNPQRQLGRTASLRTGISANGQYRWGRDTSVGANVNSSQSRYRSVPDVSLLNSAGDGMRSLYASAYYQTKFSRTWGHSRLRASMRRNEALVANGVAATGEELEWEQDWITGRYETQRPELTTTLGVARDRSEGLSELQPTAGLRLRVWPDADWSVGASLRYTARNSNLATSRGLSGTLETEKVLPGGWRLGASASLNQAVVDVSGASSLGGLPLLNRSNDKQFAVYLRWEGVSGSAMRGAGLRTAGAVGGGSLDGVVFFDANRDGVQQPGENGVPKVEVLLDGRYRVTTDATGRFEFALVSTGPHRVSIQPESVPLPWGLAGDQGTRVDIPLRGQATVGIPVVRVGE